MNHKRIALLVPVLNGGGMERVAAQMSTMFSDVGYDVYIFLRQYDKRNSYPYEGKIIKIDMNIDDSTTESFWITSYLCSKELKKRKRECGIDVTISFGPDMNLLNILSSSNDKKILTIHNCMSLREDVKSKSYRKSIVFMWNVAYRIVPVCKWVSNDLKQNYHILNKKLCVIYNPVFKADTFCEFGSKRNTILTVGRIEDIKQQWHIVKAVKHIVNRNPDIKLIIAGDGPNKKKLIDLVERLDLKQNVEFTGFVRDINPLYNRAKILVLSSKSEAFPCVAIEALSHGVPIVASDFPGGIRECVGDIDDEKTVYPIRYSAGIITQNCWDYNDPYSLDINESEKELAGAIDMLLNDDDLYIKMCQECKKVVRKFNYDRILEEWIELING